MTPEERDLLEKTHALSLENNELLKKMQRSQRFSKIMQILYWVLIVVMTVASFYLIQPYIDSLQGAVNIDSTNNAGTTGTPPASGNLNLNQVIQDFKQATQ